MDTSYRAILCVDDEAIILLNLKKILETRYGERFRYESTTSAEDALTILDRLESSGIRVILIVSDWLMPGMKGDEFLKIVHEKYPQISAIMVSGLNVGESVKKLEAEHIISGFLAKPVVPVKVYALIDQIIDASTRAACRDRPE